MNKDGLKKIAVEMVREIGLINLSRAGLCERAGIADGSFQSIAGCTFTEFSEELRVLKIRTPLATVLKSRTNPELRRQHILETAVKLAKEHGYDRLTRDRVAEAAGVSPGLIGQYFTMTTLRFEMMRYAVRHEVLEIVAQGLAARDNLAVNAPKELKNRAVSTLAI